MGSKPTTTLFSSNCFKNKMGKLLLVIYNTAQMVIEIIIIVLVVCNYSFQWKGEVLKCTKNHYIMHLG